MRHLLNNPWVVGMLCCLALGSVYWRMSDSPSYELLDTPPLASAQGQESITPPPIPVSVNSASPTNQGIATLVRPISGEWISPLRRDPFQPMEPMKITDFDRQSSFNKKVSSERPNSHLNFRLQALSLQGNQRLAVINHIVLGEGEEIEGYRLIKIHSDGVVFQSEQGEYHVTFTENDSKEGPSEEPPGPSSESIFPSPKHNKANKVVSFLPFQS